MRVQSVTKHKWAHPFKRPVTDKEAPDYKEVIANPMDFATLKQRIVAGDVQEAALLVSDLNLIFDNAMVYNGKGTDYYRMAHTLKEIVRVQHANYVAKGGGKAVPAAEEAVKKEAVAEAALEASEALIEQYENEGGGLSPID